MNADEIVLEIQETVRSHEKIAVRGWGSKPALCQVGQGAAVLQMTDLQGTIEYQPEEFTFTAWAGSHINDIQPMLAAQGQFLPFDPLLVDQGATLGGTTAAGLSGSGRYRFGGLRDFLLGVKFVDGLGNVVRSGGKVVKNAAGFDLAKFMVGSLGMYGVLLAVTIKVFPKPAAYTTLRLRYDSVAAALQSMLCLASGPLELFALDLAREESGCALEIRLGGNPDGFPRRLERLKGILNGLEARARQIQVLEDGEDAELWRTRNELTWAHPEHALVKVPITPRRVPTLESELAKYGAPHLYSAGASSAWIAWEPPPAALHEILTQQALSGLAIRGIVEHPLIGMSTENVFSRRAKQALDPLAKFSSIED